MHNDSGDGARVYALGRDGALLQTFTLQGVDAVDWEDIAIGPGPATGVPYLFVADIGDNDEVRDHVVVYRFAEPEVGVDPDGVEDVVALRFRYPDVARDAEALLVDPLTGDLLIVTKSLSGRARVFRASGELSPDSETVLDEIAGFRLGIFQPITAGDIGRAGDRVALRTYSDVLLWRRMPDQGLAEMFGAAPCRAPLAVEPQGEAIGFDHEGSGYYTVSEGTRPPLHYYAGP